MSAEHSSSSVVLAVLLLVIAVSLCYSNSLSGPFVFDDVGGIVQNESIRNLTKIRSVLTDATYCTVVGRPLLNLSLAMNYSLSRSNNVLGYHLFNIAIHLLAAITLFAVVRRTLLLGTMPARIQTDATELALAVALIWAVHPLQTESVTYMIQRAESMVSLFYLLTLYCLIRGATGQRSWAWFVTGCVTCFLGMSTKEVMVTAPLIVLIYDRIFLSKSFREILERRWGYYFVLAATWIWLAVLMLSSDSREGTAGFGMGITSWDYAMTQFGFIIRYLRLTIWPHPLVLDYGISIARTPAEIVPYALVVLALLVASFVALGYRPWIGFLGLTFFVILSPTSTVVPMVTQTAAEHRMYLPLAPIVVIAVITGWQVMNLSAARISNDERSVALASNLFKRSTLLVVVAALGIVTYRRNFDYRSELSIWKCTATDFPSNARAHCSTGEEYLKLLQFSEAIEPFSRSIELRPGWCPPLKNRAHTYKSLGRFEEACSDFVRAAETSAEASSERAQMYYEACLCQQNLRQREKSIEFLNLALIACPDHQDAKELLETLISGDSDAVQEEIR